MDITLPPPTLTAAGRPDGWPTRSIFEYLEGRCCICCERARSRQTVVLRTRRLHPAAVPRSAFAGFCFPRRDHAGSALLPPLRVVVPRRRGAARRTWRRGRPRHVYRWVLRFTPLLAAAARPCRHAVGGRWEVDE